MTVTDLRERIAGLTDAEADLLEEKLRAKLWQRRWDRWTPYPWQIPPDEVETHGMWLQLGGRGTGKTDGCARYMVAHVNGPPCDDRVPGGHRMSIIAPTQGDAVESAVNGPSGLKAHDPRVVLRTTAGGTHVRWPSGAEAKLFGAHTPDDVERLRSGGNRCVAEGTPVQTDRGPVPIEQVRPGDRVWTRHGLRQVLHVWDNGVREVQSFEHDGGSLRLTPDHQVWTDDGWKPACFVRTNDRLTAWENTASQWSTQASSGIPARTVTTRTRTEGCCTASCGSRSAGRSLTACRCTTSTTTSATTALKTSSSSRLASTGRSTATNAARTGTESAARPSGRARRTALSAAPSAAKSSAPGPWPTPSTAESSAATERHDRSPSGCAWCAQHGFPSEQGQRPVPVRASALRSTPTRSVARVYDLTVEHDHEFFAGGLLVANCLVWLEEAAAMRRLGAALTHSAMGLRVGPNPHYIASTTPKPRKEIRDLLARADVITTKGRTRDAIHLPEMMRTKLVAQYAGTRLERQELDGELIDDIEGALWSWRGLDATRVGAAPPMTRIVVAIDPAAKGGGESDEMGIIVAGLGQAYIPDRNGFARRHGYILDDLSGRMSPEECMRKAAQAYHAWKADRVIAEVNNGGDWIGTTLRQIDPSVNYSTVTATRGKQTRAEPVAAVFDQLAAHIVTALPALEEQLTTWVPGDDSPDRLDAMVWAITELMLAPAGNSAAVV